jgi:hypothetical protein
MFESRADRAFCSFVCLIVLASIFGRCIIGLSEPGYMTFAWHGLGSCNARKESNATI